MEDESLHVRYLIVITAFLCALIIGYNAFYVPDISMSDIAVMTDISSAADETYTPRPASGTITSGAIPDRKNSPGSEDKKNAESGRININTATAQQMSDGLDGIGDVMSKRIVAYREKNGKFKNIEEIKNVSGIGDKTFAKLKDYITV